MPVVRAVGNNVVNLFISVTVAIEAGQIYVCSQLFWSDEIETVVSCCATDGTTKPKKRNIGNLVGL